MAHEAGKGDAPRKTQDQDAYSRGWDAIFGSKKKDEQPSSNGKTLTEKSSQDKGVS